MKKFRVYIEQVNQTYYDVAADDAMAARTLARRQWLTETRPQITSVEELEMAVQPGEFKV